ncbi:MAG: hypothetical protein KDK66_05635 [Deltaproteobacteria bacterium]|nr:hypothetical protein [Deltaproteobacteria bacterium]
MTDISQKRPNTPFAGSVSYSTQLAFPAEKGELFNKGSLGLSLGGKYGIKRKGEKTGFSVPLSYAKFSGDFSKGVPTSDEPLSTAFVGSSVGLQFSPKAWDRFKSALVLQGGFVWRKFSILESTALSAPLSADQASAPSQESCEAAIQDNPFASPTDTCSTPDASHPEEVSLEAVKQRSTGLEASVTLKTNFTLVERGGIALLGIGLEGRARIRGVPKPDQWATSFQPNLRGLVGFSFTPHPKVGKFLNFSLMGGVESNLKSCIGVFISGVKFNFDVTPKGL